VTEVAASQGGVGAPRPRLSLTLLSTLFALCRLDAAESVPAWTASARAFLTISRTPEELSIVADEAAVPSQVDAVRGYRALRIDGPMPLELVGVMAALATPLAAAGVPIFPIATYDTDYVLIRGDDLTRAIAALEAAGHRVASQ
jgi:hypothetical protein